VSGRIAWKRVLSNIIALLTGSMLSYGLSAIAMVMIARQIGPEAYGQYSASIALVGLTTVLFALGLDVWVLYRGGREPDQLRVSLASAFFLKMVLGIVWLIGWWIVSPNLDQSSFPRILISLAALSLWLEELVKISWNAFKARLRSDLTLTLMLFGQGIFLASTLWLVSQSAQEPAQYMGGKLLAALLGAVASTILVMRRIGLHLHGEAIWPSLKGTMPFAISIALTVIYGRADLAIVASRLTEEAAGVYAPALTVANVLFFVPAAVFGVMVPVLGRGQAGSAARTKVVHRWLFLAMGLLGAVLGVGLALMSDLIINLLYGLSFQASGAILATLSMVVALRCPTTAIAAVLVAEGWQRPRTVVQGFCAALNVLLNLLIIDTAGVMGVAKVYVLTEAVLFLGHLGMYIRWMKLQEAKPQESF
jgi:O-antigen/teichoic acid export membrane protein